MPLPLVPEVPLPLVPEVVPLPLIPLPDAPDEELLELIEPDPEPLVLLLVPLVLPLPDPVSELLPVFLVQPAAPKVKVAAAARAIMPALSVFVFI